MTGNAVNRTNQESTMSSSGKGLRRSPSSSARNAPALPETPVLYRIPALEEPAPVSVAPVETVAPSPPPPLPPAPAERAEEPSVELPPKDSAKATSNQRRRRRPRPEPSAEPKRGWDPGSKFLAGGIFLVLLLMLLTYLLARNNRNESAPDLETTEDLAAVLEEPQLPESTIVEPIADPERPDEVIRPQAEPVAKNESPPEPEGPALLQDSPPAPSQEDVQSPPPPLAEDGEPVSPPTEQSVLAKRSEPASDLGLEGPSQTAATSETPGEPSDEPASTTAERPNWATDFTERVQANPYAATSGTSNSPPGRLYPETGYAPYQFELALEAMSRAGATGQAPRMTMREGMPTAGGVYGASPPAVPQQTYNPPPTYNNGYQAPPLR